MAVSSLLFSAKKTLDRLDLGDPIHARRIYSQRSCFSSSRGTRRRGGMRSFAYQKGVNPAAGAVHGAAHELRTGNGAKGPQSDPPFSPKLPAAAHKAPAFCPRKLWINPSHLCRTTRPLAPLVKEVSHSGEGCAGET